MKGRTVFARWTVSLLVGAAWSCLCGDFSIAVDKPGQLTMYIGTFTGKQSKGIYLLKMDAATGALSEPELAAETARPSWVALHPNRKFLYAVAETQETGGKKGGAVRAFAIDEASGKLTLLNEQSSGGAGPCYVNIDLEGKNALVANYSGGNVGVLPIEPDGKLKPLSSTDQHEGHGADPKRQKGPFAHCFDLDPSHRFALNCDLGMDKVFVYKFDASKGTIAANDPPTASVPPGSGPRHLAFHPSGKFVYVINEMGLSITAFSYDADKGVLKDLQTVSTVPADFSGKGSSCAEIVVHPSGKFVYGSNRGHDTIAIFSVDPQTGKLTPAGHQSTQGKTPRGFAIAPGGEFLVAANQDSGNLFVFRIDQTTGALRPTGATATVGSPVCVVFVPPTR